MFLRRREIKWKKELHISCQLLPDIDLGTWLLILHTDSWTGEHHHHHIRINGQSQTTFKSSCASAFSSSDWIWEFCHSQTVCSQIFSCKPPWRGLKMEFTVAHITFVWSLVAFFYSRLSSWNPPDCRLEKVLLGFQAGWSQPALHSPFRRSTHLQLSQGWPAPLWKTGSFTGFSPVCCKPSWRWLSSCNKERIK